MSYNKHDFDVVITKNPIAYVGCAPRPPVSEIHLCVQTPLSENPGSAPVILTYMQA